MKYSNLLYIVWDRFDAEQHANSILAGNEISKLDCLLFLRPIGRTKKDYRSKFLSFEYDSGIPIQDICPYTERTRNAEMFVKCDYYEAGTCGRIIEILDKYNLKYKSGFRYDTEPMPLGLSLNNQYLTFYKTNINDIITLASLKSPQEINFIFQQWWSNMCKMLLKEFYNKPLEQVDSKTILRLKKKILKQIKINGRNFDPNKCAITHLALYSLNNFIIPEPSGGGYLELKYGNGFTRI